MHRFYIDWFVMLKVVHLAKSIESSIEHSHKVVTYDDMMLYGMISMIVSQLNVSDSHSEKIQIQRAITCIVSLMRSFDIEFCYYSLPYSVPLGERKS